MASHASNPNRKGALQTAFIYLIVASLIMLGVGITMYFVNQDNQLMPDAGAPPISVEVKPVGR